MPEHEETARIKRHARVSPVWLIPIAAAALVLYLGFRSIAGRGPVVTLILTSADGLTVDETKVKHKAVALGTVEQIDLSQDLKTVVARIRMNADSRGILTDHARFWVVRPRLSSRGLTGIETLVSGVYLEVDPGEPGGKKQDRFTALTEPPGRESDELGHVYELESPRPGSLSAGSPVLFRNAEVGRILSYDVGQGLGPVRMRVFVREPFDKFVHPHSRFWNASGLSVTMGAEGVHVELASLQALVTGGIAFETADDDPGPAPESTRFELFDDKAAADSASYAENIPYVAYFASSVQGLTRGSPVLLEGVQVGSVRDVRLVYGVGKPGLVARIAFDLQPERVLVKDGARGSTVPDNVRDALRDPTMRVQLESSNLFTGSKELSMVYGKLRPQEPLRREGEAIVVPSQPGGIDALTATLSDVAAKIDKVPFEQIGANTNEAIVGLQEAVRSAKASLGSTGYGTNSDFQHDLTRVMSQITDAARAVRVLADDLDRHPEELLRGRAEPQGGGGKH